jgi:hypothetical protein
MVGIHALSIAKTWFEDQSKPKRRPLDPFNRTAAPQCSGPLPKKRSCAHQFAIVSAFGSVFERLGCPHKVADTRLALTTDR